MNKPELLSPAGSWETLKAAASAGADAVYFGGHSFNARRNAGNFDDSQVGEAIAFCHARGIKAYITLNTILFQNELKASLAFVKLLCDAGADAVIVQDLGLIRLIRQAAPSLRLHASTQMSVHNLYGVQMLAKMGLQRVVLARELSRSELEEIIKDAPIEIEVFVHGALCMSVSGQCYMSAMLGGRSGNRGLCAQPCRLPFSAPGGTGNDLSLKDLSLCGRIGELAQMGVASLKIEGRMKRPEYVATATAACVTAVKAGACTQRQTEDLQSVFSRAGFTQGYYEGETGRNMFGARGRDDVIAAQGVLSRLRAEYEGVEPPRVEVKFSFTAKGGEPSVLCACDCDGNTATVTGIVPETARTRALDEALVKDKFAKTGGTPFFIRECNCTVGEGLSLPVAELNRLRREALEEILQKRMAPKPVSVKPPEFSTFHHSAVENNPAFRVRIRSMAQLTDKVLACGAEITFLSVYEIAKNIDRIKTLIKGGAVIGAELPRAVFGTQWESVEKAVDAAAAAGVTDLLCGNLGPAQFALTHGFTVHGDFGLNISNSYALDELLEAGVTSCVLSLEAMLGSIGDAARVSPQSCGVVAYGNLPLMLTRNCPLKNGGGCAACAGAVTDRRGGLFPITCFGGASELLNGYPLWLCDRKEELFRTGIHFAALYFSLESPQQTDAVIDAWQKSGAPVGEFTRGLYFRGVQ
jgi:putative protease